MFFKCVIFLLVIYFQSEIQTQDYGSGEKLNVHDRIKLLKRQLLKQIRENQDNDGADSFNRDRSIGDNYEYIDLKNQPITPIMDFDKRKLKGRWKHKPMVRIKPRTTPVNSPVSTNYSMIPLVTTGKKKQKLLKRNKPSEIFYRRWEGMDKNRNTPLPYMHCLELLTGYLAYGDRGEKTCKVLGPKERVVLRLLHLLSVDVRGDSQEEIYSILYQISNLKLRLFEWDPKSIVLLMNQITKSKEHHFQTLKRGVKELFLKWRLDFSNASSLLEQSRIFRPPCIQTSELSGSTKTSRAHLMHLYTKSVSTKKICTGLEFDDDSCETKN